MASVRSVPIDLAAIPVAPTTRFAPAPTGFLHMGHLVNALFVWGIAGATDGRVLLRIEDHDRGRSRAAFEGQLLDDLERLGLIPDEPTPASLRAGPSPWRQSDNGAVYQAALDLLHADGLAYPCDCTRGTFADFASRTGTRWRGPGCPGGCRARGLTMDAAMGQRVALGDGREAWTDALVGPCAGEPAAAGDLLARDGLGNWTYPFCVVVDDLRQGVDLVIRGRDLLDATAAQLRLARLLAGGHPARFLHHPLVVRRDGSKLSKADGATAVHDLLARGATPAQLLAEAARFAGFDDVGPSLAADGLGDLFRPAAPTVRRDSAP